MRPEHHVEQSSDGHWEVRDRADVWVSSHPSKREAQAAARAANKAGA